MMLILPRVGTSPMRIEGLLHLLHLLDGRVLSIFLHSRVNGGVYLQTFRIVCIGTFFTIVIATPVFHPVAYSLTEVVGFSVVGIFYTVVEFDFRLFQRVTFLLSQVSVLLNQIEHHISASQRILGIDARVIIGCRLEQSHQHGSLLGSQFVGCCTKIGSGSSLDAKGIRAEIYSIGIHGQNLILREVELQLIGGNPFLALHNEHFQPWDIAQQTRRILRADTEQVLGQLLRNGRCATCITMHHVVFKGCAKSLIVNTMVAAETLVFCIDKGIPEGRANVFVSNRHTILAEEFAYHFAVSAIDLRGFCRMRILDVAHGRRLTKKPQEINVHHDKIQEEGYNKCTQCR